MLERTPFVAARDDHDYGVQDAHSRNQKPFGLGPWDALMARAAYHRFAAGVVDVWVLDQRLFKTPPDAPDTEAKTLLGARQRAWLLRTLAASRAPFKVICSPCTLSATKPENPRDGNWSGGYTAERDLLLRHIADKVTGRTRVRHRRHPLHDGLRPRRRVRGAPLPARHPRAQRHHPQRPARRRDAGRTGPAWSTPTTRGGISRCSRRAPRTGAPTSS